MKYSCIRQGEGNAARFEYRKSAIRKRDCIIVRCEQQKGFRGDGDVESSVENIGVDASESSDSLDDVTPNTSYSQEGGPFDAGSTATRLLAKVIANPAFYLGAYGQLMECKLNQRYKY